MGSKLFARRHRPRNPPTCHPPPPGPPGIYAPACAFTGHQTTYLGQPAIGLHLYACWNLWPKGYPVGHVIDCEPRLYEHILTSPQNCRPIGYAVLWPAEVCTTYEIEIRFVWPGGIDCFSKQTFHYS